jgi:hypothetical protein
MTSRRSLGLLVAGTLFLGTGCSSRSAVSQQQSGNSRPSSNTDPPTTTLGAVIADTSAAQVQNPPATSGTASATTVTTVAFSAASATTGPLQSGSPSTTLVTGGITVTVPEPVSPESLPVVGQPTADPIVLPPREIVVGGSNIQLLVGSYDVQQLVLSTVPLVVSPLNHEPPAELVLATVSAGSATPVASVGSGVLVSYQLLRWDTGEVADATPAGEPVRFVLGSPELPAAISKALEGVSPGAQRVALFPAGTVGLPTYIPDDVAYVLVVTVSVVVAA